LGIVLGFAVDRFRPSGGGSEAVTATELQVPVPHRQFHPPVGCRMVFICSRPALSDDKTSRINYGCCCLPGATRAIAGISGKAVQVLGGSPDAQRYRESGWRRRFNQKSRRSGFRL